jgi:hypothetical protein
MNPVNYNTALSLGIFLEGQLKRLYTHAATIEDIDEFFATFAAHCAEREEMLLSHRTEATIDAPLAPAVHLDLANYTPDFRSEPSDRRSFIAEAILLESNAARFYHDLSALLTIADLRELFETLAANNADRLETLHSLVEVAEGSPDIPDISVADLPETP